MTVDFWYHVDATHGSFNAMKSDAAAEHAKGAPRTVLSVTPNVAGTEAIVKVRTKDGTFSPGWENAPFVIRKYNEADYREIFNFLYGPEWTAQK